MHQIKRGLLLTTALATLLAAQPVAADDMSDLKKQMAELQKQLTVLQEKVAASEKKAAIEKAAIEKAAAERTGAERAGAEQMAPVMVTKPTGRAKPSSDLKVKWEPAPSISSPDGNFEMNLRGRVIVDTAFVNDSDNNDNIKATEFRAARIGIEGKAWNDIKYKFEADFSGNDVAVTDAYLQWQGPAKITIGQFKTPNSLEEQTSGRYTTFMERASFTDAFGLARQIGISAALGGDNYTVTVGVFRGDNDTVAEDEGLTFAARATYSPVFGSAQWHFGASFRSRNLGDDQSDIRYRQRPHAHLANRFINTGTIADKDTFYGVEAASIFGPLSFQAEWAITKADLSNPSVGQNDPTFSGGYIEVSYFITGEKRAYSPAKGTFGRIKLNSANAVQVAAKFDRIDLTDEGVFGGEQDTFILGASLWVNRYTRFSANYSYSRISEAFAVIENGADGANKVNTFGLRAQVDW
ncbi:MAG: hypothetical protein COB37_00275 [Kordiimonadales bacterium]|nr:MAG: hypothetical protein COB37_00275 [Kordiimonadales bacterium]